MLMLNRLGCMLLGNRLKTRYLIRPIQIQYVALEMDIVGFAVFFWTF